MCGCVGVFFCESRKPSNIYQDLRMNNSIRLMVQEMLRIVLVSTCNSCNIMTTSRCLFFCMYYDI